MFIVIGSRALEMHGVEGYLEEYGDHLTLNDK